MSANSFVTFSALFQHIFVDAFAKFAVSLMFLKVNFMMFFGSVNLCSTSWKKVVKNLLVFFEKAVFLLLRWCGHPELVFDTTSRKNENKIYKHAENTTK